MGPSARHRPHHRDRDAALRSTNYVAQLASRRCALLMPELIAVEAGPSMSASSVHDEVMANLAALVGPRVVATPAAESAPELCRSMAAGGGEDLPEWVLSISVRAARGQVQVLDALYRGPDYTVGLDDTRLRLYDRGIRLFPREIA